jgi:predicted O-methyltransferase YrrM
MTNLINMLADNTGTDNLKRIYESVSGIRREFYDKKRHPKDVMGGSPTPADLTFLNLLVQWRKPCVSLEVGSWIGVSSAVIADAGPGMVYTCDQTDHYKGDNPRIKFIHKNSSEVFAEWTASRKIQFAFIDANLSEDDSTNLLKLFEPGHEVIAIHDLHIHNGRANLVNLTCRKFDCDIFIPDFSNPTIINGVVINDYVGLILGCKIMGEL